MTGLYVYQMGPDSYLVIDVSDIRSKHDAMVIRDILSKHFKVSKHISMRDFDHEVRTTTGAHILMVSCDCHYPAYQTQREEIEYHMNNSSYDIIFMWITDNHENGEWHVRTKMDNTRREHLLQSSQVQYS